MNFESNFHEFVFVKLLFSIRSRKVEIWSLRESVSKLVCDWEGLGGRGGEEVHDDSIKKIKRKIKDYRRRKSKVVVGRHGCVNKQHN